MPVRSDPVRGLVASMLLLALVLSLTGCELIVEESPGARETAQHTSLTQAVTALPDYDVAVSAVDFDPPLRRETLVDAQKPVKLLAAIESKGTMALTQLVVEARITSQNGDFSAQDRLLLERLAPGETKVVEFEGMAPATMLPRSPFYRIKVSVEGRQADAHPQNNSREVTIRVVD